MNANWLDIFLGVVLLISLISAVVRGLTHELISLAAAVIGFLTALWWYPLPAGWIGPYTSTPAVAGFIGFCLILMVFVIAGALAGRLVVKLLKASGLRWFDRLLGAAFGVVRGLLLAAAIVLALVAFTPGPEPITAVAQSRLAPVVMYGARAIVLLAPRRVRDGFYDGFERLRRAWREAQADSV